MQEMAQALIERGHEVALLCGLAGDGLFGLRSRLKLKLGRSDVICDTSLRLPVFRSWHPWEAAAHVRDKFKPDIVVPHSGLPVQMSHSFRALDVPTMIYFRNVDESDFGGDAVASADGYVANSRFTAERLKNDYNIDAVVIPPLFEADNYRVETSRECITFINPHPSKGRDIAFDLAKLLPDEKFIFVRAWSLDQEDESKLQNISQSCANIEVIERTDDMKQIYSRTKVVLVPSRWEEAWGRVVSEAHFSGIPVIATSIGGLPEAVGPGGILMEPEATAEDWSRALRALCKDGQQYSRVARAALDYSRRDGLRKGFLVQQFVETARKTVDSQRQGTRAA
ncbi:glycosyltransferase [Croceicoccus marinus]|uniref:Glycosyltransferase n=2 Tax=Croceicoccus marinus TaxID=450378 RepID=A0A7G6VT00_9SPHN|nr:glycosyltransferase [Croceicoccus marinus]